MIPLLTVSLGLIAYAFIGYPLLIAAMARIRPTPLAADPGHRPSVSLIILAYNEERVIRQKLENTLALQYPADRLQLIVVADGSDDDTADISRTFPGVVVLDGIERHGKLAAMHRGAAAADGEILLFSDANNHYDRDAVSAIVEPFADPPVGVVSDRKAIDDGDGRPLDRAEGLYWRYESRIKAWESGAGSVSGVVGEILAFRREAFPTIEAGTMNEDFVQAMTAAIEGWRVVYAPRALSLERASATMEDELTRRSRLVTGRWQALRKLMPRLVVRDPRLAWQIISHKGLRPIVPFAMLAALASNLALSAEHEWAIWLAVAQGAFYAVALIGWFGEIRGWRSRAFYLPYYSCRVNVATLRGCADFALGRHEAVWAKVRRA